MIDTPKPQPQSVPIIVRTQQGPLPIRADTLALLLGERPKPGLPKKEYVQ